MATGRALFASRAALTSARHFTSECRAPACAAETSIERLVLNAPVGGRARSRQHHLTLQIENFHLGPAAHLVVAVERQLTADLGVLEHLARGLVVEDVPHRQAIAPPAEVTPDAVVRSV